MPVITPPTLPGRTHRAPFSIDYLPEANLDEILADEGVLAAIRFGSTTQVHRRDPRLITVGLAPLNGQKTIEVWRGTNLSVRVGRAGEIRFAHDDTVLFACLLIDENHYPNLEQAAYDAYLGLRKFVQDSGYPFLPRIWNYFPRINAEREALERYQAFCLGRHRALSEHARDFESTLPAACAIGTQSPGLLIYALASKQPGRQIENPRQISAFHYPRQYGPRSPSFSRAVLQQWGSTESHLYISGTASIVGHATRHGQDLVAQGKEICVNLEALIANANGYLSAPLKLASLKVYSRCSHGLGALEDLISQRFGASMPTLFLHGDICRSDLLVEVEGVAVARKAADRKGLGIAPG
jgi:chorismate lyase/3-hydroxybenzoate synthase